MERTPREHVFDIEERRQMLRDQLTKPSLSTAERTRIQHEIATSELVLTRYFEVFELEQKLARKAAVDTSDRAVFTLQAR